MFTAFVFIDAIFFIRVLKFRKHSSKKIGLPQGTLVHIGDKYSEGTKIQQIQYTQDNARQISVESVSECSKSLDESSVFWLQVTGIHDPKIIQQIGDSFDISNLTLEEVMNTNQHPKIEEFQNYLYVNTRTYYFDKASDKARYDNISIILGKNFVITFQEKENTLFESIQNRINDKNSLLRKGKNDYLFCTILDTVVDHYFPTLEHIEEKIEKIESRVSSSDKKTQYEIYQLRQEITVFSKILRPQREFLSMLLHSDSDLIEARTSRNIHDVYEHVIHLLETLDLNRENLTGLHDLYLSTISNRMNEVMKMLAIIASLFIPITFVAGVYGMNFQHMPELNSPVAYPAVLVGMAATTISLFFYFKKKKWV